MSAWLLRDFEELKTFDAYLASSGLTKLCEQSSLKRSLMMLMSNNVEHTDSWGFNIGLV